MELIKTEKTKAKFIFHERLYQQDRLTDRRQKQVKMIILKSASLLLAFLSSLSLLSLMVQSFPLGKLTTNLHF